MSRFPNLRVEHISKMYRPRNAAPVQALDDINFEVEAGETLGIIGHNGAGKSTLLKILAGFIKPGSGKVLYNGAIGSILDLGWSFHPHLTGIENVQLTARLSKAPAREVKKKLQDIMAFSELDENILRRQVYTYSSGMYLRLAFATAMAWPKKILIFDEVMTVGDAQFQLKSARMLAELKAAGHTILFVSHDLVQVNHFSDRVLLLNKGRQEFLGRPADVIRLYQKGLDPYAGSLPQQIPEGFAIDDIKIEGVHDQAVYNPSFPVSLIIKMNIHQTESNRKDVALVINDYQGRQLFSDETLHWEQSRLSGQVSIRWDLPANLLNKGVYSAYLFMMEAHQLCGYSPLTSFEIADPKPEGTLPIAYHHPFYLKGALKTQPWN